MKGRWVSGSIEYPILAALFGLLLGSFLNVCIYRVPRDLSVVMPRSFCPECGVPIHWYDNIPLVSYVLLRGKCRDCRQPIGIRYPIVELATACLFAAAAWHFGWNLFALKWMIFDALLVVLFWTDYEEQLLPDEFTLGGTAVGLLLACFAATPGVLGELLFPRAKLLWQSLFNSLAGATLLALPIWLLGVVYQRVRKREGLGLGDVKLLLLIGVFLGVESGIFALMIGAIAGSLIGAIYVFATRKKFSETELPLGTFLCASAALVPFLRS